MAIDKSQFLTPTQLAKVLGISRVAVHQKIKKNEIKAQNIGDSSKPTYIIAKSALPAEIQDRIKRELAVNTESIVSKSNHHDLEIERELWAAADKLRGNIDVSEYKNLVLGLLFLKYISDAFYKRREELKKLTQDSSNTDYYVADEKARLQILETEDFYKSVGVFYVPEKSRWEYLQTKILQSDIGQFLDKAMEYIEENNRSELEGVLPKVYTGTTLDPSVLGELVNIFSRISFDHDFDREKDILGRIYEYFLGQFASSEGKRGGEFFTPRSIVRLLVEILEPYENGRVLDPACGSGGMFVSMGEYLRNQGADPSKLIINGQESNLTTLRLAKMNLAIRGLSGKVELGNTYYDDKFPHLQADFVIANPPFNAEWQPARLADNDPRFPFGIPPAGNANFMWVQHFTHHLAPHGHAGFVMPNSALASSGKEGEIRKKLIESDLVDIVISCPPKLFYNVSLPVSLWFLSKDKKGDKYRDRNREVLFIDSTKLSTRLSKKQVIFSDENILEIAKIVKAWRGEDHGRKYENIPGLCKAVRIEDIADKNFVLTPALYVGASQVRRIPALDQIKLLSETFKESTSQRIILTKKILKNLSSAYPLIDWNKIDFTSPILLESLAESIFRDRFSKYLSKEEGAKLPNGWEWKSISSLATVILGGTPSRANSEYWGGNIPWINSGAVNEFRIIKPSEYITEKGLSSSNVRLMPPRATLIAITGATLGQVSMLEIEAGANQSVVGVYDPNQVLNEYIYLYIKTHIKDLISHAAGGAQQHINKQIVEQYPILVPSKEEILEFHNLIKPLFDQIKILISEEQIFLQASRKLVDNEPL